MKAAITFLLSLSFIAIALGQEEQWKQVALIKLNNLDLISTDNQGFIFASDLEGNLFQFDKSGLIVNNFSPIRQSKLSQLEASWTVNIFTFSADLQEYRILDRFLNPISENNISQERIGLAKAATLGNNNIIWIYDESDLSLKQFDYRRNQILQHQPLSLILNKTNLDIIDIREYQNLLFLNIKNEGVYIFDNQGNFIRKLKLDVPQKLAFWKEKLIYIQEGMINLVDYQSGIQKKISLPDIPLPQNILIHQKAMIFYGNNQIMIFDKDIANLLSQK